MEKLKYPVYMGMITDVNFDAIHTMSVVDEPAVEETFIYMNRIHENDTVEFAVTENEKRMITGPALIPDKLIFRNDRKRGKHYLTMTSETIEQASQKFLKDFNQSSVSVDHLTRVQNMTIVESWIIEDPDNDKSAALGFKLPKGTWMISMKVDNDSVWEAIKEGRLNGFSIEAMFTLVNDSIVDESKRIDKEARTLLRSIKKLLEELDPDDETHKDRQLEKKQGSTEVKLRLEPGTLYEWVTNGSNPCPTCDEWESIGPMSGAFWLDNAVPGVKGNYPHGPYGTYCEAKCTCDLVEW